jgi:hypothetical protein
MTDTPLAVTADLLPCPFCEAPARFVWGRGDNGSVKCTRPSCGARSGDFMHERNAVAAWNTRIASSPPPVSREEVHAIETLHRWRADAILSLLSRPPVVDEARAEVER